MGIGNKKILSEVRKVRQVSSFRNSLLRFPARGKSQPIRYLGLFRLLCVSGAFSLAPKRTLDLHLAYFSETLYSASPQTNKKALILLRIRAFSNFCFLEKRCVRDSNSSRNPFCTNILFNQVFKVQRLIQREEFAVLLSFDRLNWNNAKIVKNNNMTKFRYITHCFFEVFVLS